MDRTITWTRTRADHALALAIDWSRFIVVFSLLALGLLALLMAWAWVLGGEPPARLLDRPPIMLEVKIIAWASSVGLLLMVLAAAGDALRGRSASQPVSVGLAGLTVGSAQVPWDHLVEVRLKSLFGRRFLALRFGRARTTMIAVGRDVNVEHLSALLSDVRPKLRRARRGRRATNGSE